MVNTAARPGKLGSKSLHLWLALQIQILACESCMEYALGKKKGKKTKTKTKTNKTKGSYSFPEANLCTSPLVSFLDSFSHSLHG